MKVIEYIMRPITKNPRFYVALLLLFSISIITIEYGRSSRMRSLLEVFSDIYFLCLFIMVIPVRYRKWAKYVVFAILYVIGVTDMLCYQIMGIALVPNVVQTWLQTNGQEASEALAVYLSSRLLQTPISLFLALPFIIYIIKGRIPRPSLYPLAILFLLTIGSAIYGINNKRYLYGIFTRVSDDDMKEMVDVDSMTHEYLPVYRLLLSIKEISRFSNMRAHLYRNVRHTAVDSCSFTSPCIVLVIGESYNRHHASLYGYSMKTTPVQDSLFKNGNLSRFNDVVSSYNLTFKSFQNMLTLYDYDSRGNWYDYPVLPALFKKSGYEVCFYSNQSTLDKASAFTDYTEDVFMDNPEITDYMFTKRNVHSHAYDMELVDDYLQDTDTAATCPQFVVFHFIGIHADFKLRYPQEQTVFRASDYHRPDLDIEEKEVLADYDNAILYNDKVLSRIIRTFEHREAVIIYVPDHGELVYDNCREMGRNLSLQPEYVIPQYDIPFWIYCSKRFREQHPDMCKEVEEAVDRPFMTDDLPHLLLYFAGIQCKGYNSERNLISRDYNVKRRRIINGEADYDFIKAQGIGRGQ